MATGLVIVVRPGYQLGVDEPISRESLNKLGQPTIELQGTIDQVVIADGAVTEPKLAAGAVTHAKLAAGAVNDENVAADAAIAVTKLAAGAAHQLLACRPDGTLQFVDALGDVVGQVCKSLPFDGMVTGGLAAGMKIKGVTSGATGTVAAVVMSGPADGRAILADASGAWLDNENIIVTNEIEYDGLVAGKAINVGDAVLGQSSGATGVVLSKTDTRLVLREDAGTWLDNEGISVNGDIATAAIVNGPYTVRAQVDLDGKTYDDAAFYAWNRDRRVLPGDLLDRSVATSRLKPEGAAGQVLRSRGLYLSPQFETITFRPSALVTLDDPYAGRKAYTWRVASYNDGADYLTLDASVTMADVNNGDPVCFSGPTGNLPTGVSRGVIYYIGDKEVYGARTVRLYADAGLTTLVALAGAVTTTNVYLHRRLGTTAQGNCSVFKDTDDAGGGTGANDGYYQIIYTAALTTSKVVLCGACTGYQGSYPNYFLGISERDSATTYCRFCTVYVNESPYAADKLRLAVFENP